MATAATTMTTTTYDGNAGKIRAVYGKTRGLIGRRKALLARAANVNILLESSSSSEEEDGGKGVLASDTTRPAKSEQLRRTEKKITANAAVQLCESDEDEIILPYKRRTPGRARRIRDDDEQEAEANEGADELVKIMSRVLQIANTAPESKGKQKESDTANAYSDFKKLLKLCKQARPVNFSDFLTALQVKADCDRWRRFGEASYSEVYGLARSASVLKIIPLIGTNGSTSASKLPDRSEAKDVHREVEMTRGLAGVSETFVKISSAQVVQGRYPARLLNARDAAQAAKSGSLPVNNSGNNATPENFAAEQTYAALELRNGGQDLESIEDLTWKQAASIFCQVVHALASAEVSLRFEHRDLHWGNIVVAAIEDNFAEDPSLLIRGQEVLRLREPASAGIKATIIDYTLSRATIGENLIAYDFSDPVLFEGSGDMQFDIYRQMKQETKGDWSGFYPHTNVLWLNYLASKLIEEKKIPNPKRRSRLDNQSSEELECRNFLMQTKQSLLAKRFESASDLDSHLIAVDF